MLPVAAVHLYLVTVGIGIRGRATERLGPVGGESLDMLGVEAVVFDRGALRIPYCTGIVTVAIGSTRR